MKNPFQLHEIFPYFLLVFFYSIIHFFKFLQSFYILLLPAFIVIIYLTITRTKLTRRHSEKIFPYVTLIIFFISYYLYFSQHSTLVIAQSAVYDYPTPAIYDYPTPAIYDYPTPAIYDYPTPAIYQYPTPATTTCSSTGCTQCLTTSGGCFSCLSTSPVCFASETDCGCPAPTVYQYPTPAIYQYPTPATTTTTTAPVYQYPTPTSTCLTLCTGPAYDPICNGLFRCSILDVCTGGSSATFCQGTLTTQICACIIGYCGATCSSQIDCPAQCIDSDGDGFRDDFQLYKCDTDSTCGCVTFAPAIINDCNKCFFNGVNYCGGSAPGGECSCATTCIFGGTGTTKCCADYSDRCTPSGGDGGGGGGGTITTTTAPIYQYPTPTTTTTAPVYQYPTPTTTTTAPVYQYPTPITTTTTSCTYSLSLLPISNFDIATKTGTFTGIDHVWQIQASDSSTCGGTIQYTISSIETIGSCDTSTGVYTATSSPPSGTKTTSFTISSGAQGVTILKIYVKPTTSSCTLTFGIVSPSGTRVDPSFTVTPSGGGSGGGSCNNNNVCEAGEDQVSCPNDCKTTVTLTPNQIAPGKNTLINVDVTDGRYAKNKPIKLNLLIDSAPWGTSLCGIDNVQLNPLAPLPGIKIISDDRHVNVESSCTIPSNLKIGQHTLTVIPTVIQ